MENISIHQITLNGIKIKYTLKLTDSPRLTINLIPKKGLFVTAPHNASLGVIRQALLSKSNEILYALNTSSIPHSPVNNGNKSIKREILLKNKTLKYTLTFKNIKRINVRISAEKGFRITAPFGTSIERIEAFLRENSDYIYEQAVKCEKLANTLPKPKKYVNGEYIMFMGEKKNLCIIKSKQNYAEIEGDNIKLFVTDTEKYELKNRVFFDFLKEKCKKYVVGVCKEIYPRFEKEGIEFPKEILFKKMVSCWGYCKPSKGVLVFSSHLIQLPAECIEEIICHEFTHFLYPNHSKEFYKQLGEFMPDWKSHTETIRKIQNEIIIKNNTEEVL